MENALKNIEDREELMAIAWRIGDIAQHYGLEAEKASILANCQICILVNTIKHILLSQQKAG
jgi:hypothetical protein